MMAVTFLISGRRQPFLYHQIKRTVREEAESFIHILPFSLFVSFVISHSISCRLRIILKTHSRAFLSKYCQRNATQSNNDANDKKKNNKTTATTTTFYSHRFLAATVTTLRAVVSSSSSISFSSSLQPQRRCIIVANNSNNNNSHNNSCYYSSTRDNHHATEDRPSSSVSSHTQRMPPQTEDSSISQAKQDNGVACVTDTTSIDHNDHRDHHRVGTENDDAEGGTGGGDAGSGATGGVVDIEDLHKMAVQSGERTYIDPATGFTVFTELIHLKRGSCCGNKCRHCPYGWENVPGVVQQQQRQQQNNNGTTKNMTTPPIFRKAKCKSGDPESVQRYQRQLLSQQQPPPPQQQQEGRGGRHGGTWTRKNVPYTRTGDKGTSQLLTGERRMKNDFVFEAMGTVDELCSVVGVAHAEIMSRSSSASSSKGQRDDASHDYGKLPNYLLEIMSRLFDIGSHLAKPRKVYHDDDEDDDFTFSADGIGGGFDVAHIRDLEEWIDTFTEELPELLSFILPTGGKIAAQLHVARTVCRRAERCCVSLIMAGNDDDDDDNNNDDDDHHQNDHKNKAVLDPHAIQYLNRLSDFFFSAARYANHKEGKTDLLYCLPHRGAKQRNLMVVRQQDKDSSSKSNNTNDKTVS